MCLQVREPSKAVRAKIHCCSLPQVIWERNSLCSSSGKTHLGEKKHRSADTQHSFKLEDFATAYAALQLPLFRLKSFILYVLFIHSLVVLCILIEICSLFRSSVYFHFHTFLNENCGTFAIPLYLDFETLLKLLVKMDNLYNVHFL